MRGIVINIYNDVLYILVSSDVMISNAIVERGHSVSNHPFRFNLTTVCQIFMKFGIFLFISILQKILSNGRGCLSLNPRNSVSTRSNYIKLYIARNVIGKGIQICH